ncbi:hypothetical protein BDY19DRAFT_990770 [Irpex rosettiformis]|uniref:Uncharacterized protein n=1 Tax=Irpex rosettiformis TaxID=378272 RepID=A0ACB8UCJ3_9APHY|nr:hypothetical protein BDY19DRAFT_990770 [Irpex rosettiformis]
MTSRVCRISRNPFRTVSIFAAFISAVLNVFCAARVIAFGGSLKWDFESEGDALNVDAVKFIWFLLVIYFAAAATASVIGFIGIARRKLNYVRFFRDYSIVELAFMFVGAVMLSYTSFGSSSALLQAGVCEELGRQPDLLRDMAESGLNLENCEYWFGRAAVAVLGVMLVFAVIRLHFVIALSKYYAQLRREGSFGVVTKEVEHGLQKIYLLPTPTSSTFPPIDFNHQQSDGAPRAGDYYHDDSTENIVVYAPVPLSRLSVEDARGLRATAAWISPTPRRHHRHHSHSHAHSGTKSHKHRRASVASIATLPYRDESQVSLAEKL